MLARAGRGAWAPLHASIVVQRAGAIWAVPSGMSKPQCGSNCRRQSMRPADDGSGAKPGQHLAGSGTVMGKAGEAYHMAAGGDRRGDTRGAVLDRKADVGRDLGAARRLDIDIGGWLG